MLNMMIVNYQVGRRLTQQTKMYYRRGSISTTKRWGKPTLEKITAWYNSLQPVIAYANLNCNVLGSCVYNLGNARDLDIGYTGVVDTAKLEYLLNTSIEIGLKLDMLIDAKWVGKTATTENLLPADTDFIFLDYYEEDDGNGSRVIRDYSRNSKYQPVGNNLVKANFKKLNLQLKPHQIEYIKNYGTLPSTTIQDYIKDKK
jgi:hypothetical protein